MNSAVVFLVVSENTVCLHSEVKMQSLSLANNPAFSSNPGALGLSGW